MSERMKNVFGALALATAIILATSGIWNAIKAEDNADTSAGNNVGNGDRVDGSRSTRIHSR